MKILSYDVRSWAIKWLKYWNWLQVEEDNNVIWHKCESYKINVNYFYSYKNV